MNLQEMTMRDLLDLHNRVADEAAGPKTFSTRGKLVARIEQIAEAKSIDLASFGQPKATKVTEPHAQQQADAAETTEAPAEAEKKPSGLGIGRLARGQWGITDAEGIQPSRHRVRCGWTWCRDLFQKQRSAA